MTSNKTNGNTFERKFCVKLSEQGFWVHNVAQNAAGQQPADVIAVRDGRAYLIDCKDCTGEYFSKTRIEENQRLSMGLWEECGNGGGLFAVKIANKVFIVPLWKMEMSDKVNLDVAWFAHNSDELDIWLEMEKDT